jgi:hypothetical protein
MSEVKKKQHRFLLLSKTLKNLTKHVKFLSSMLRKASSLDALERGNEILF